MSRGWLVTSRSPFILPLMPTVTHTFSQSRHFPENRGRRFTKLFLRVHIHAQTQTVTLKFLDSRRASRSSCVVNTNCRSIIGFFGVVGSRRLPRRTTYPRVAALADIWHASTAETRKPLCMPTTRRLYTSRHYRRSLSAQHGSRSRYFEIQPPARKPFAVFARAFAWRESLFYVDLYQRIYRSILLEKYISPMMLRNRRGRNKVLTVRFGREKRFGKIDFIVEFRLSLGLLTMEKKYLFQYLTSW